MISGFFAKGVMPQPLLRVAVRIPAFNPVFVATPFVIDTGAAVTCIHAIDATRRFGIPEGELDPTLWSASSVAGGVGGSIRYRESPSTYGFPRDDGGVEMIEGMVRIGEFRSGSLPSLLGWDLLRHFRIVIDGDASVTLALRH